MILAALVEAATAVHDRAEVHIRPGPDEGTHVVLVFVGMAEVVRSSPGSLDAALEGALDKLRAISTRVLTSKVQAALEKKNG